MYGAFLIGLVLQVGIMFIPWTKEVFGLVSLNSIEWIYVSIISIAPIVIIEIQKKVNELLFGKRVFNYMEAKG